MTTTATIQLDLPNDWIITTAAVANVKKSSRTSDDGKGTEVSVDSGFDVSIGETDGERRLFKRHICPVCPANVKLGKNGSGSKPCCPARTLTKTVTKTSKIVATLWAISCAPGYGDSPCYRCPAGSISQGGQNVKCTRCANGITNHDQTACRSVCTPLRTQW